MQFMLLKLTLVRTFFVKLFFGRHEQFAAKIMNKTETRRMIKKLENAYTSCNDCGTKWGVYSVGCSSIWMGICQVCGEEKPVTEARDYAYFMTGIRKLKLSLQKP